LLPGAEDCARERRLYIEIVQPHRRREQRREAEIWRSEDYRAFRQRVREWRFSPSNAFKYAFTIRHVLFVNPRVPRRIAMKTSRLYLAWAAALGLSAARSQGGIIFQEAFPTDTANTAETVATYTDFTYAGGGNAYVSGGVLHISGK